MGEAAGVCLAMASTARHACAGGGSPPARPECMAAKAAYEGCFSEGWAAPAPAVAAPPMG